MTDTASPEACGIPHCGTPHEDGTPFCDADRRRLWQTLGGGPAVIEYHVTNRPELIRDPSATPRVEPMERNIAANSLHHAWLCLRGEYGQHIRATDYSAEVVQATKEPPTPIALQCVDAAARIEGVALEWESAWRDVFGFSPPEPVASVRRRQDTLRGWFADMERDDPEVMVVMAVELREVMVEAHSLSPWRAKAERQTAPCPGCHEVRVVRFGGEDWFSCSCGRTFPEDEWARYSAMVAQRGVAA